MNNKTKKILIILIVVLLLVLAGLLVYQYVLKPSQDTGYEIDNSPENNYGEDIVPESKTRIKAISQAPVISPVLTQDKKEVTYYLKTNGSIWQSNFDGSNLKEISGAILNDLVDIIWSPEKTKVISVFENITGDINKYFYDYNNLKAIPLNKNIKDITWSPESSKIAYQYQNEAQDENTINTANPDGSNFSTILRTRIKDLIVEWPRSSEIFLRERPSGLAPSSLYSLDTLSGGFSKKLSNIYGLSIKWSADGKRFLYSKTDSKGKNISIYTSEVGVYNEKAIQVATLAEKCVWSQDPRIIYCAVPKIIGNNYVLPDDFYKEKFYSEDEFWKINIETKETSKIIEDYEINELYNASDLFLSPEEDYLFFTDKKNGLLYSIEL